MSTQGDVFDPRAIVAALKGLEWSHIPKGKDNFERVWKENVSNSYHHVETRETNCFAAFDFQVNKRVQAWSSHKDNKATPLAQLEWEAAVVEYVDRIYSKVSVHGNSGALAKEAIRTLEKNIPLLGPRFVPPTLLHRTRREATPHIKPEHLYLKPITAIHPMFYSTELKQCPQCSSSDIRWDGWNATGARVVYGIQYNERALGYQMRCKGDCKTKKNTDSSTGYCIATTNQTFWDKWEHWRVPSKCVQINPVP